MLLPGERELRDLTDLLPADLDDADGVHARFEHLRVEHERRLRLRLAGSAALLLATLLVLLQPLLAAFSPLQTLLVCLLLALLLATLLRPLLRRLPPERAYSSAQEELARSWESLPTAALHLRLCVEAGVHRRVAIALGLPDAPGLGSVLDAPEGHAAADLQDRAAEVACTLLREGFVGTCAELVDAARACVDEA